MATLSMVNPQEMAAVKNAPLPQRLPSIPSSPLDDEDVSGPRAGTYVGAGDGYTPYPWLPTRGQLTYMRELFSVVLLIFALPVIFMLLMRSPGGFAKDVALAKVVA